MSIAYEIQKAGQAALDQIHSTFSGLNDLKNSSDQLLANKTVYANSYSTGNYTTYSRHLGTGDNLTINITVTNPMMISIWCSTGTKNGDIIYSLEGQAWRPLKYDTANVSSYYEIYKPAQLTAGLRFTGSQNFTMSRERLDP